MVFGVLELRSSQSSKSFGRRAVVFLYSFLSGRQIESMKQMRAQDSVRNAIKSRSSFKRSIVVSDRV